MSLGRFSSIADFSTLARASGNGTFRKHPLTGHWSASLREGRADTEHPPRPVVVRFLYGRERWYRRILAIVGADEPRRGRSRSRLKVVSLRFRDQQSPF